MTEVVIPIPNEIVVSIPVDFLMGVAAAYYVAGFALVFMDFRLNGYGEDTDIAGELMGALIIAPFWPMSIKEYATIHNGAEDAAQTSENDDEGESR